jgi:hypothetical protein
MTKGLAEFLPLVFVTYTILQGGRNGVQISIRRVDQGHGGRG